MNIFTCIGRVGRDAVTRYTGNGKPVTGFSLAVDSGYGDNKQTTWLDCSAWGERYEKVAQYITKGAQLGVSGELGTREHEGKTYVTLRVNDVTLVGKRDTESAPRATQPAPATRPATSGMDDPDDLPF